MDKNALLYVAAVIKGLAKKYNYSYKWNSARMSQDKISLPVDSSGTPDIEFMSNTVQAIQNKLVKSLEDAMRAST